MHATLRSVGARSILSTVAIAWLALVLGGLFLLLQYKNTPGVPGAPPSTWPASSTLARDPARATLVLLAHPKCTCTRATLHELAVLLARVGTRVSTHVLFVDPGVDGVDPRDSDLWRTAASIPGVDVRIDRGEAASFGALTSGQVVLYDAAGALLYAGGITGARGHEGDNIGRQRVASLIEGAAADAREAPVFGCELTN